MAPDAPTPDPSPSACIMCGAHGSLLTRTDGESRVACSEHYVMVCDDLRQWPGEPVLVTPVKDDPDA